MKTIDWKTFIVLSILFSIHLVNPRDFPVNNVPLVYPAFLLSVAMLGPRNVLRGFWRTRFLSILIIVYWYYHRMLLLIEGRSPDLGDVAYLIEPLMMFAIAGAAGSVRGGIKAGRWAFVFAVTFSAALGLWIYFFGEPVSSWRSTIHNSISGNLLDGGVLGTRNQKIDWAAALQWNAGLSLAVFTFSYQLAAALSITIAGIFCRKGHTERLILLTAFLILVLGVITNSQRASVVSVPVGLLFLLVIERKKVGLRIMKAMVIFTAVTVAVIGIVSYVSSSWDRDVVSKRTVLGRSILQMEELKLRAYVVIPAIVAALDRPFGSGKPSAYYNREAKRVGWVIASGEANSPHNHYVGIVLGTGIVGMCLVILLFMGVWVRIRYLMSGVQNDDVLILLVGCITCLAHALTHNAGFFNGGSATNIVFGLLWSATSIVRRPSVIKSTIYPKSLSKLSLRMQKC